MKTIGKSIKEAREKAKMTKQDLSQKSGVSACQIYEYEADRKTPSLLSAISLADALGITIDKLIGRENVCP